jgi:catechol 2,3-dioxygenase-like lactoylglutathione lyase family enzyme
LVRASRICYQEAVRTLQHVSVVFATGDADRIRGFYGSAIGLREIRPPKSVAHLGLIWFSAGEGLEVHLFSGTPEPTSPSHFCLSVEDLDGVRRRLTDFGAEPYDDIPIPNRPRFFCRDPSGNLVEFTQILGAYEESA